MIGSGQVGGGSNHVLHLLPALLNVGIECNAIVGDDGPLADELARARVPVDQLPMMRSRFDPASLSRLSAKLRGAGSAVVHGHGTRAAFLLAIAPVAGARVYTAHGLSFRGPKSRFRRAVMLGVEALICLRSDAVISVSARDLADLGKWGVLGRRTAVHIPNGVDTAAFESSRRMRDAARRRLGIRDQEFVVGTVARLVRQKGVADLIEAASGSEQFTALIVGDGELRSELELRAQPARDRVRFLGTRDNVQDILGALDAFVLPSHWEGEPIALLEAMAAGLPCIATRTTGTAELLRDGANGLLVPIADPTALREAILRVQADPDLGDRLGAAASATVQGRSWEALAVKVASVYQRVSGGAVAPA